MNIEMIKLDQLELSPENVRSDPGNIANLAASIEAHGLIHPLTVVKNGKGYQVIAGGRRLRAMQLLVEEKRRKKSAKVPCLVAEGDTSIETSLAENYFVKPMEAAERWRAFAAILEQQPELTDKDLAKRFDLPLDVVRRTLRLGRLHPTVLDALEQGKLDERDAQAFAATEDQELQLTVWLTIAALPSYEKGPHKIRQLLGVTSGRQNLNLAVVGLDGYEAAGGRFERDLFQTDENAVRILDTELLDELANQELRRRVKDDFGEGFELAFEGPSDWRLHIEPTKNPTPEQQAIVEDIRDRLAERQDNYHEIRYDEDLPDENREALLEEIDSIKEELADVEKGIKTSWPEGRKIAVPKLSYDGTVHFQTFLASHEELKKEEEKARASGTDEGSAQPEPDENDGLTNKAKDTLASARGQLLAEACASTYSDSGRQVLTFLYLHLLANIHYGGVPGFRHIGTHGLLPEWVRNVPELRDQDYEGFLSLPTQIHDKLAAIMLHRMVNNQPVTDKEPSLAQALYGDRAQAEARPMYWEPSADFFDMFKKKQLADMVREIDPDQAAMIEAMKVAEAKERTLKFFTEPDKVPGLGEETRARALEWIPTWFRLGDQLNEPEDPTVEESADAELETAEA